MRDLARARRGAVVRLRGFENEFVLLRRRRERCRPAFTFPRSNSSAKRIFEITSPPRAASAARRKSDRNLFRSGIPWRCLSSSMSNFLQLHTREHLFDFEIDDLHQVRLRQLMEDDDVVEPVEELRLEGSSSLPRAILSRITSYSCSPVGFDAPKPIVVCRLIVSAPTFDVMMMIVFGNRSSGLTSR